MAKLKGPLFSLGASQQLGKTLVYFGWKGLDVVREYVIPSNPRSTGQVTQRGYLTSAVLNIHSAQAHAVDPMTQTDISAYALWASVVKAATTWFNQLVKNMIDQEVASKSQGIYTQGSSTPADGELAVELQQLVGDATAGNFWYGTSKTSLINSQVAVEAANNYSATLAGLTNGTKYYWQFRPTAAAAAIGALSGIYHGTPAA